MKRLACAFCPKSADSEEHLWPDWVSRLWAGVRGTKGYKFHTLEGDGLVHVKRRRRIDHTVPVVCRKCNNGWMGTSEQFASRLLPDAILSDKALALDETQQFETAFWAIKSAIVLDHTHLHAEVKHKPFLLPSERFPMRTDHRMPRNVLVLLARYGGRSFTFAKASYSESTPKTTVAAFKNRRIYSATLAYGQFVVQVVIFRRLRPIGISKDLLIEPIPQFQTFETQLWPSPSQLVAWPPPRSLDNSGLWAFAHQWGAKVPVVPRHVDNRR